jgi:DNA-binding NarL/FixJ family response regulator
MSTVCALGVADSGAGQRNRYRASPMSTTTRTCDDRAVERSVLLVDDHAGFRAEARAMLEMDDYVVVGEAATSAAAVSEASRLRPDIVLLDVGLPDGSGLDLIGPIRSVAPGAIVILISSRLASDYGDRLSLSAADGFLDKTELTTGALHDVLARRAPP